MMVYLKRFRYVWMKSHGFIFSTIGVVLLSFTACSVGPDYVKPTVEVPPSYKENEGWKVAEPKDNLHRGAWWEIFNDSYLNTLEEQVNISNQNIVFAEAQLRQARAQVRIARAAYFPTVTIGSSYTRSFNLSPTTSGTSGSTGPVSDYSLPLDVSWEPDLWGRVRRTVESSKANFQASAADVESARLLAQTELAQDYFQLRALDQQKEILDETVTAYEKFLELTKNRYASGIASKADVYSAETQLKTTQAQLIDIGVQRAQLEHAIALLIGKPASAFSISPMAMAMIFPAIPVGIPSELLERRPDIAAAERRAAAANAQIGVAKAAYYPTVTLSASGGFQTTESLFKWLRWSNRFWAIGGTVSETLFDGGVRFAQTDQARAAYDATVASYREAVLTGFQQIEDNLAALRILEEEAQVQDEAVKAAQQSVSLAINQYKAGIVSYLNVIIAQAIALADKRNAVDILSRRLTASVLLIQALGGGWDVSELSTLDHSNKSDRSEQKSTKGQATPVSTNSK